MRARLLKPGFFSNEALGQLPPVCRLLFEGLWCLADREGRLEDRPARIRVEVFPYDRHFGVDAMLGRLAEAGLIIRYAVNGKACIWLPTFSQHQKCHPNEAKSTLPSCPLDSPNMPKQDQGSPMVDQGATKVAGKKSGKRSGIGSSSVSKAVPPPTPSVGGGAFEDDEDDPEALKKQLDGLFPGGWKTRNHA